MDEFYQLLTYTDDIDLNKKLEAVNFFIILTEDTSLHHPVLVLKKVNCSLVLLTEPIIDWRVFICSIISGGKPSPIIFDITMHLLY